MSLLEQADDATETDADAALTGAGRLGLATRGAIYLISALLTVRIATNSSTGEGPGKDGAIKAVAEQPFGRVLVALLAVGFAGYAIWRFAEAVTYEPDPDDSDTKALGKRAGLVGRGCIYLVALWTSITLAFGGSSGGGGGGNQEQTSKVFGLPFGRWIVLAVGIGFLIAAGYNGYRSLTGKYREKWNNDMSETQQRWATVVSSVGLIGHLAVFALIGFFLSRAAIQYDPNEPVGIDAAVRELAETSHGTWWLIAVAIGMAAYAGFSFVEARWRELLDDA